MRLKCDRNCFCSGHARACNDIAQNVGMGPMNAVEISHADQRRSVVGRDILELVKNLHIRMNRRARRRNQNVLCGERFFGTDTQGPRSDARL